MKLLDILIKTINRINVFFSIVVLCLVSLAIVFIWERMSYDEYSSTQFMEDVLKIRFPNNLNDRGWLDFICNDTCWYSSMDSITLRYGEPEYTEKVTYLYGFAKIDNTTKYTHREIFEMQKKISRLELTYMCWSKDDESILYLYCIDIDSNLIPLYGVWYKSFDILCHRIPDNI